MKLYCRETDKSDNIEDTVDSEVQEPNPKIKIEALAPKQGPAVKQPALPSRHRLQSSDVSVLQSKPL